MLRVRQSSGKFVWITRVLLVCFALHSGPAWATDPTFTSGPFTVEQNGKNNIIIPEEKGGPIKAGQKLDITPYDSVCVLTRITGDFQGSGEGVYLQPFEQANGFVYWNLQVWSQQQGVAATSYCFNRRAFLTNGATRWEGTFLGPLPTVKKCRTTNVGTWWGDAATMISGMSGKMSGGGESVTINQSSSGFTPSILVPHSCQEEFTAWASTFFAGTPHTGQVAQFWGPNGQGPANAAGEWQASTKYGTQSVQMAPTGEAMCYFSSFSGKFRGGAESVEIKPTINPSGVEVWTLVVNSHQDGMAARSLCYKRDQH